MTKKKHTLREVWDQYGLEEARKANSKKHIAEINLHLRRWESHFGNQKKVRVKKIERHHMEDWRRKLVDSGLSPRTANKHLATVRRILIIASNNNIIRHRPKLESLPEPKGTQKLYLRNEQIDALFDAASGLRWPPGTVAAADWWRCALIMYRTYGFRTQELLAYESSKRPLTWQAIHYNPESPDENSNEMCDFGWLSYVPPKTKKKKPDPITVPLTKYTRAALDIMAQAKTSEDSQLFPSPRHQERFFETWYGWLKAANVTPKNPELVFQPRHLRKTAATYMNQHRPGLATAVCRWGKSVEADVAQDHYIANDLLLRELHNVEVPKSFEAFLFGSKATSLAGYNPS